VTAYVACSLAWGSVGANVNIYIFMVDVRYSLPVFAEEFQLLIIRKGRHLTIYRCVNDEVVDLIAIEWKWCVSVLTL
jgi:hypothetical protein